MLDRRQVVTDVNLLPDGGGMASRIAGFDWSATPLGPIASWPQSRRTAVDIMLRAPMPACTRWGRDGIMLYNDAYAALAGDRHPGLLGTSLAGAWPEIADFTASVMDHCLKGEPVSLSGHHLVLRRNGRFEDIWLDISYTPVPDESGAPAGLLGMMNDVTARILAEREQRDTRLRLEAENERLELALHESEHRFRSMADSAPALIWATDPEGRLTFVNRRHETEFGLTLERLSCEDWRRTIHEEDAAAAIARFHAANAARMAFTAELRMRNLHGALRWMRCDAVPRFDEAGTYLGFVGCNIDMTELYLAADVLEAKVLERTQAYIAITEQLQAEMRARERAEQALRQSHKMEAVGQLTGGLAHDFNNLLTGIIGNLELMQNRAARSGVADFDGYIDGARSAARRATALTHRLLAFSRRQVLEPRLLRIEEMMEDVAELIGRTIGPAITLEIRLAPGLWATRCDQNQLENALLNLAINARDAMPEGGTLTIETENVLIDQVLAAECGELAPGDYIAVAVRDTGTGMSEEVAMRAFDPFFTTKPSGQGTGLGLSMIYGFIKQSGGHIRISSTPGEGTLVRMYLPRCTETQEPEPEPVETPPPLGGNGERIVIVDDEACVRLLVSEMLGDLGYDVRAAEDGPSALAVLDEEARVDLLVADIGLPGMSGQQLAEMAKQKRPNLKVLFITGYAEGSPRPALGEDSEIVTKPFSMSVLASKIHDMVKPA